MTTKLGVLFPGQGSQSLGMLSNLAADYPSIQQTFKRASKVLGFDLWQLCQVGPAEALDQTVNTQPALLAASYALWQLLEGHINPQMLAGHSLGEYSALVCAQAFSFEEGIKLVAARGSYMQDAVPANVGGLGVIVGLNDASVAEICNLAKIGDEVLSPANFNADGQVVVAGHKPSVERALILAKEKGAKIVKLLPVSVPSHCLLMKPAAERLATLLNQIEIKQPQYPVLSNVNAQVYTSPDHIRTGLIDQLYQPVQWVRIMQYLKEASFTQLIECGPGRVLCGLAKRALPNTELTNITDTVSLQHLFKVSAN